MFRRLSNTTLAGDFAVTMLFSVTQLLLAPISTSLLARYLGTSEFGTYSSIQRLLLFIAPLSSLGVNVGLTRYVAQVRGKPEAKGLMWTSNLIALVGAITTTALIAILWPLFMEDDVGRPTPVIFLLTLVAFTAQTLLGAWLRGNGDYFPSNIALLTSELGKLGLLLFFWIGYDSISPEFLLLLITFAQFLVAAIVVLLVRPISLIPTMLAADHFRTLLSYSAPRVPGGLALQALTSIGVFYFAINGNSTAAGFMAISLVILNAGSAIFTRLGSILMPHIAFEMSKAQDGADSDSSNIPQHVQRQLSMVISLLLTSSAVLGTVGLLVLPPLIVPWLGSAYEQTTMPVSILTSCIGIAALYSVLSGAINAIDPRPLNTVNLTIVVLIAGAILYLRDDMDITEVALLQAAGFTLLGILTLITTLHLFKLSVNEVGLEWVILLAVVNALIVAAVLYLGGSVSLRIVGVLAIAATNFLIIYFSRPSWFTAAMKKVGR